MSRRVADQIDTPEGGEGVRWVPRGETFGRPASGCRNVFGEPGAHHLIVGALVSYGCGFGRLIRSFLCLQYLLLRNCHRPVAFAERLCVGGGRNREHGRHRFLRGEGT